MAIQPDDMTKTTKTKIKSESTKLPPGYVTVAEFAKMPGVSRSTVYRWIAAGMPAARISTNIGAVWVTK
jgi:hypothetical protein